MTIPIVFGNGQEIATKTALNKNYLVFKRALKKFEAENGFPLTSKYLGKQKFKEHIINYLNIMLDCGMGYGDQESACIPSYDNRDDFDTDIYHTLNGGIVDLHYFDDGQFVLTDGTLVLLENRDYGYPLYISVDLNGHNKRPNRLGKDLFMFQIMDDGKLLPMGTEGTVYTGEDFCSENSTESMNGAACTVEILRN